MDESQLIEKVLQENNLKRFKSVAEYAQDIITYEIPDARSEIRDMDKEEIEIAVKKINMLGSGVPRPVDEEVLDYLHEQTLALWGNPPSTATGEWAEWCLWHHKRRYEKGNPVTKILESEEKADATKERVEEYISDRTGLWKERTADSSSEYEDPKEVPDRLRDLLLTPSE